MDGWIEERWIDDEWMDGWMDGRMDGWMDRRWQFHVNHLLL